MSSPKPARLPVLVRALIGWLAGPRLNENVLGDLQEEFAKRSGETGASIWVWKEVLRAVPGLIVLRARSLNFRTIGLTLLATVAAHILLLAWGLYVVRPAMIGMRDIYADGPTIEYVLWYLPFRIAGILLVGTVVAYLTFRSESSFSRNFTGKLAPLMLVLILPQIWLMFAADEHMFLMGSVLRILTDIVALFGAAFLGGWLRLRNPRL